VNESSSKLLVGTGNDQKHLIVVVSADRGLCGGFNSNLARSVMAQVNTLIAEGKEVGLVFVGRKSRDVVRPIHGDKIWKSFVGMTGKSKVEFVDANEVTQYILSKFDAGEYDVAHLAFNTFESVLTQKPTINQIIPFDLSNVADEVAENTASVKDGPVSPYMFEPDEEQILSSLLPRNIGVQIYSAMLNSAAGEHAARMTAMDNATRNAGEMINDLSLKYNRARQAHITKELIEIISGAEAL